MGKKSWRERARKRAERRVPELEEFRRFAQKLPGDSLILVFSIATCTSPTCTTDVQNRLKWEDGRFLVAYSILVQCLKKYQDRNGHQMRLWDTTPRSSRFRERRWCWTGPSIPTDFDMSESSGREAATAPKSRVIGSSKRPPPPAESPKATSGQGAQRTAHEMREPKPAPPCSGPRVDESSPVPRSGGLAGVVRGIVRVVRRRADGSYDTGVVKTDPPPRGRRTRF